MDDKDVLRFKPPLRQFFIDELGYIVLMVLCFFIFLGNFEYISKFTLIAAFSVLVYLIYRLFYIANTLYIITGEQLIYMHGVFIHSTDYMELYRVVDYQQYRSLPQLVVGLKTVVILSGDRTMPVLKIIGMNDNNDIVGVIRKRVEYNKRKRGVYEITNRY